jgi:N-ethylmaleimide reductase
MIDWLVRAFGFSIHACYTSWWVNPVFSAAHVAGWRKITDAVHSKVAEIFVQLMHPGRIGHQNNLPLGVSVVGPSAIVAASEMYTDTDGKKVHPTPKAMTEADIKIAIGEFEHSAKNAVAAGFEGIELHSGNGYLLEQFFRLTSNQRVDAYGGSFSVGRVVTMKSLDFMPDSMLQLTS